MLKVTFGQIIQIKIDQVLDLLIFKVILENLVILDKQLLLAGENQEFKE